jgi:hypothetical protein
MDTTGQVHFINIEYFFELIYQTIFRTGVVHADYSALAASTWLIITGIAYVATLGAIGALVYFTVRLQQLEEEDEQQYGSIEPEEAKKLVEHSRWAHVQALVESPNESDWRQAIIEADIMLDDTLALHGYQGQSVGEKLKQADSSRFHTLQDAWEAHKVRNEIAHRGSSYQLGGQLAYRTIGRYMNVFEEFHVI